MGRWAEADEGFTIEELAKATRNRGMPLEALALDVTPVGLHYLLIHFDMPLVDPESWSLRVGGNVVSDLELTMPDIMAMPKLTQAVTLECAGNGRALLEPRPVSQPWLHEAVSTAAWGGVALQAVLERAGLREDTVSVVFTGADRGVQSGVEDQYRRGLTIEETAAEGMLLAYEMNGRLLEPQHGAPLRLVAPGWYGMAHVKWLTSIEAVAEPFEGIQHHEYRYRRDERDPGEPATKMRVRSLMVPPGIPDNFTRQRFLPPGEVTIRGRAWSGAGPIDRVEIAVDGTWHVADLDEAAGPFAWRGWSWKWNAEPGGHVLACRATDTAGNEQPTEQVWNTKGLGNNVIQQVPVMVG